METITLRGVTLRWDGDELILTTRTDQERLDGSDTARLLDFLLSHQQEIFSAEQHQALPSWAQPHDRYIIGQITEECPTAIEGPKEE